MDLSPNASTISWTGEEIVAWDYGLSANAYDPASNQWRELPSVPLEDQECYPRSEFVGRYALAWLCGQAALWDVKHEVWEVVETPKQIVPGDPVVAGEVLLFVGATHEGTHNSAWIYSPPGGP